MTTRADVEADVEAYAEALARLDPAGLRNLAEFCLTLADTSPDGEIMRKRAEKLHLLADRRESVSMT